MTFNRSTSAYLWKEFFLEDTKVAFQGPNPKPGELQHNMNLKEVEQRFRSALDLRDTIVLQLNMITVHWGLISRNLPHLRRNDI